MAIKIHILFIFLALPLLSQAQQKVELKKTDNLSRQTDAEGNQYNKLVGNVYFIQGNTRIYCDAANFYSKNNLLEAFGNVRIYDGDSVVITSKNATYNGETKFVMFRKDVIFKRIGQMTVYTDFLDYNRETSYAKYFNGGRLVDEGNELRSRRGYFDQIKGLASFKGNVKVDNEGSKLESDTLQYNLTTKEIYFLAQTKVIDSDGNISNYKSGKYNTITKQSILRGGRIQSGSFYLEADNIFMDDITKMYNADGMVYMKSDSDNVVITGGRAIYNKETGYTKIFENAIMRKPTDEGDTLYLAADTLVSIESEHPELERMLAYKNVRIYKSDLQGRADSLVYTNYDSTIHLYNLPVLWASGSQISADTVGLKLINNQIDKLEMYSNGFIITQDTIKNFNQLKGRHITTFFKGNAINRIDVLGNAESLFHILNDDNTGIQGINKVTCSKIKVFFKDQQVERINQYVDIDSYFIPPHELKPEQKRLQNFSWRDEDRPILQDIFYKPPKLETKKEG